MNKEVYAYALKTYGRSVRYWIGFVAEAVRMFFVTVFIGLILSWIVSDLARGDLDAAMQNVFVFFIAFAGGSLIGIVGEYIGVLGENRIYGDLTKDFYRRLTTKDMSFYRDNQTGYLISLFRQHLDGMLEFARFWRVDVSGVAIMFIAPIVIMWSIDWRIGVISLALVLVQVVYVTWASRVTNSYREKAHETYRRLGGRVSDEITNIVAYKNLGDDTKSQALIHELSEEEIDNYSERRKITMRLEIPRAILTAVGMTVMFYFVVSNSDYSPESVGVMALVMTYMFQLSRNAAWLPSRVMNHDDIITKVYPTLAYLSRDHESIHDPQRPKKFTTSIGKIVFDDVSFAYKSRPDASSSSVSVLEDFSLNILSGEQVGVVGLSGAGKSTLASLIMRFDDVTAGAIKIDGIDIRDVRQADLRRHIAFVPQEPLLFHDTVRANIAYQIGDSSEDAIIRAAKAAHAHEFVMQLPDGYDTIVGERGIKLSGGQKQRIVIARAILKKAPIMLFDEATSALDSESEAIIQKAMPEIIGKRTAIVIAHRLSTVMNLDRIVVLEKGTIIEQGSHEQLLKLNGRYAALWRKQSRYSLTSQ
jgi:ATP-binding cassette subfamily B protein